MDEKRWKMFIFWVHWQWHVVSFQHEKCRNQIKRHASINQNWPQSFSDTIAGDGWLCSCGRGIILHKSASRNGGLCEFVFWRVSDVGKEIWQKWSSDDTSGWMGDDVGCQQKCSRNAVGGIASTTEIWPPKEATMGAVMVGTHFWLSREHKCETTWPERTNLAMQGHFLMFTPCPCIVSLMANWNISMTEGANNRLFISIAADQARPAAADWTCRHHFGNHNGGINSSILTHWHEIQ